MFRRRQPMSCPYAPNAYAVSMRLVAYGHRPDSGDAADYTLEADTMNVLQGVDPGRVVSPFHDPTIYDGWPVYHRAVYEVIYTRRPYAILSDQVLRDTAGVFDGMELARYVLRQKTVNVREMRMPDYNFVPEDGDETLVRVNGFIPTVESEYVFTWYQVPFQKIPHAAIRECRMKINQSAFDQSLTFLGDGTPYSRAGFPEGTMLFIDAQDIDVPYEGADGGLYCDVRYVFRHKENRRGDAVCGHNHFLAANGEWVRVKRRGIDPPKYMYESTDQFDRLFTPGA